MATTDKESSAAGTDNRPPMLEEREGEQQTQVTREKTDEEFTEAENNKERADIQATNILVKGSQDTSSTHSIKPRRQKRFRRMWSYSYKVLASQKNKRKIPCLINMKGSGLMEMNQFTITLLDSTS
ncbi:hypothetical protein Tco_1158958 [Tanacetum coccineum]